MIQADPAGLKRDKLPVRTHSQESKKYGKHTGYGAYNEEKERAQIAKEPQSIPYVQFQAKKHIPQLQGSSHKNEEEEYCHAEEKSLGMFEKKPSLKKIHASVPPNDAASICSNAC